MFGKVIMIGLMICGVLVFGWGVWTSVEIVSAANKMSSAMGRGGAMGSMGGEMSRQVFKLAAYTFILCTTISMVCWGLAWIIAGKEKENKRINVLRRDVRENNKIATATAHTINALLQNMQQPRIPVAPVQAQPIAQPVPMPAPAPRPINPPQVPPIR